MNKEIEKIYLDYCKKYYHFSDEYADYMTEAFKGDLYSLFKNEYKKDINATAKKEVIRIKHMNELLKIKVRAERKVLKHRKGGVDYENEPTIEERIETAVRKVLLEMFSTQNEPADDPAVDESEPLEDSTTEELSEKVVDIEHDEEQGTEPEEGQIEDAPTEIVVTEENEAVSEFSDVVEAPLTSERKSSYWEGRRKGEKAL